MFENFDEELINLLLEKSNDLQIDIVELLFLLLI